MNMNTHKTHAGHAAQDTHTHFVTVNGKRIYFRKWKVKDRNKFMQNRTDRGLVKEALVTDCLRDHITLSDEEYKYMLVMIRAASVSKIVSYTFVCESCGRDYDYEPVVSDIVKPVFQGYGDIVSNDHRFVMGDIRNGTFYDDTMHGCTPSEHMLADFVLHISSYNGEDFMTFDGYIDMFNDMNVDEFEDVMRQWGAMRFTVNNVSSVACPHCGGLSLYEFDDLPDFFPESWTSGV